MVLVESSDCERDTGGIEAGEDCAELADGVAAGELGLLLEFFLGVNIARKFTVKV